MTAIRDAAGDSVALLVDAYAEDGGLRSRGITTNAVAPGFIETDDGYGPYGAKTVGEAGIILGPAAVANAIFNAIGHRMRDLPITRDKILEALS